MAEKKAMIKIRQLKIAFGNKIVLDDLDLDVYEGETLAIIGPSGTGKSTIIKVLTGPLAAVCLWMDRRLRIMARRNGMDCVAVWAWSFSIPLCSTF